MYKYSIDDIKNLVINFKSNIVIYGAGDFGRLVHNALSINSLKVDFFCDSNKKKQGKLFIDKRILSPEELSELDKNTIIFIGNHFVDQVYYKLLNYGFVNVYTCGDILRAVDISDLKVSSTYYADEYSWTELKIKKEINIHELSSAKVFEKGKKLIFKYLDVVVTEKCSMMCRDCSNLMPFYVNPENSNMDVLCESMDKIISCVDRVGELRIIGGEPFMNKKMYMAVNRLVEYKNADSIVIFTNATIIPKRENLECLKNSKVNLLITNYGDLSKNYDKLINLLKSNNINYVSEPVLKEWQEIGKLKYEIKDESELKHLFNSCCANDILTLFDGKLYRCPVSANGEKIGAIPKFNEDYVEIYKYKGKINILKQRLNKFYFEKEYIHACKYCKGREYGFGNVESAIQVKEPIAF